MAPSDRKSLKQSQDDAEPQNIPGKNALKRAHDDTFGVARPCQKPKKKWERRNITTFASDEEDDSSDINGPEQRGRTSSSVAIGKSYHSKLHHFLSSYVKPPFIIRIEICA